METIVFEFATKYGTYRDALHLPDNHGLTKAEIDTLQKERVNNWLAVIEASSAPPVEEEPTDA